MKWSSELKMEREQLEQRVKQLSNSITVRTKRKVVSGRGRNLKTCQNKVQSPVVLFTLILVEAIRKESFFTDCFLYLIPQKVFVWFSEMLAKYLMNR